MKSSEKKNLYRRFLEKELNAAELDEFFLLVENGEFDLDYQDVMPVVEEPVMIKEIPKTKIRPLFSALIKLTVAASLLFVSAIGYLAYRRTENLKQQSLFTTVRVPVGSIRIITH
ncbi:hypothetical protein [Pedobacter sp. NJ-S-72]